ncbi:MAG: c-type cytochrome [Gammaproteobacteria bacterium]|nr:c-type cytochrome [Gammaproteobacteria bacterium]
MSLGKAAALSIVAALAHGPAAAQVMTPLAIEGDVARGEQLAYTCGGCHGIESAVNVYPTYHVPKLGGQNADYIEVALLGYRAGNRAHPTMHAQAAQMSDQDIADVAAYFASIEGEPTRGVGNASAAEIEAGQAQTATCSACHGQDGVAQSAQWPTLAGQHRSYLTQSMLQYKNGERMDSVMAPLVAALDDETIERIATYYASIPGLYSTPD